MKINPKITQNFVRDIEQKSLGGKYRVHVEFKDEIIPVDVYPTVFPPKSKYSVSSKSLYRSLGDLSNKIILDVGTGTGIESIIAIKLGAKEVDAVDINKNAIDCAKHNVMLNNMSNQISVFKSDLFSNISNKRYDVIMANLPIVDFDVEENMINVALYDNNFILHKRLFEDSKKYLNEGGFITLSHANLQSKDTDMPMGDFQKLEALIHNYDLEILDKIECEDFGYNWINYKVQIQKTIKKLL